MARHFTNTETKDDRLAAATRSHTATCELRSALKEYAIIEMQNLSEAYSILHIASNKIVARFDNVGDAASYMVKT